MCTGAPPHSPSYLWGAALSAIVAQLFCYVALCFEVLVPCLSKPQVTLVVTSPDEVVSVSVVDGLPAGVEALDSAIYPNQPGVSGSSPRNNWWWWWFNPFQVRLLVN